MLLDLVQAGYIHHPVLLDKMNHEIDAMRGANVWGLPSLPVPYTLIITAMVKIFLFVMVCKEAGAIVCLWPVGFPMDSFRNVCIAFMPVIGVVADIFGQTCLYQGLLDLHGWLYSPNGGERLGHLPADNFLDFVQKVTFDMVSKSGKEAQEVLPYKLDIAKVI